MKKILGAIVLFGSGCIIGSVEQFFGLNGEHNKEWWYLTLAQGICFLIIGVIGISEAPLTKKKEEPEFDFENKKETTK
jgi:uncharacterized membrane protein SpoIIM required for sporulation